MSETAIAARADAVRPEAATVTARPIPWRAIGNGVLVAAALIALWQLAVMVFQPPRFIFPAPADVFRALIERPELWQVHAPVTLVETLVGFACGVAAGVVLALAISFVPVARKVVLPVMVVSQAFPVFVIAPLLVLWFGFGVSSKIVMATIAIFFPVLSAFHDGLTRTDTQLVDLGRLYGARRWQEILYLRVPAALPSLISGIRLAAVYAPIGALVGEWVGASSGLGYAMLHANGRAQTDVVFATLFLIALMAVVLRAAVDILTARLAPWAPEAAAR
jgi:putative hydroxymethylpyrimidine transport system permease protein